MKYIIICGPTCTGKTDIGVKLAHRCNGEIINADSRQVYKHTNIGTAKPTETEMHGIKHHLFDFLELSETFSAYQYTKMARQIMTDISKKGKVPVIVGGTGLYLKALTEGIFKSPEPDIMYRRELDQIALIEGVPKLHEMLNKIDPVAASKITPYDKVRLIRALEIFKQTGRSITELQKSGKYLEPIGEPLWIGLNLKRKVLYERINRRVDKMIEGGFEQEAKNLKPYLEHIRKRKMIGYIDMIAYLFDKTLTRNEAIQKVKQRHRNYAKRQLTWFGKIDQINWFDPLRDGFENDIIELSDSYLKNA